MPFFRPTGLLYLFSLFPQRTCRTKFFSLLFLPDHWSITLTFLYCCSLSLRATLYRGCCRCTFSSLKALAHSVSPSSALRLICNCSSSPKYDLQLCTLQLNFCFSFCSVCLTPSLSISSDRLKIVCIPATNCCCCCCNINRCNHRDTHCHRHHPATSAPGSLRTTTDSNRLVLQILVCRCLQCLRSPSLLFPPLQCLVCPNCCCTFCCTSIAELSAAASAADALSTDATVTRYIFRLLNRLA